MILNSVNGQNINLPENSHGLKTINAVIIYCTFKSPPDTAYTSYIDSLPYWYSDYGNYINSFIQTASYGTVKINTTVLTNGNKPFIGDDVFHTSNTIYGNLSYHFVTSVLDSVDKKYDLGKFDNDGPDGIPNSGDDDGYVDYVFLVVLWPLDRGGIGLNIPGDFISNDPSNKPGFGNIRISNKPGKATQQIIYNKISPVLVHEFGHSIGNFPDIDHAGSYYFNHYSIGSFDVMAHAHGFKNVPSIYNPYFRDEYLHWLKPVLITKDTTLQLQDLLTTGIVYKYAPKQLPGAYSGEEFYISYHTGKSRWERTWPVDKKYGGVLIWRAIKNGYIRDNNISQSICYPQIISIEDASGKWRWQEFPDSVHNTGILDPLTGFDSLEIRKTRNGKEIEGPYYGRDVGSSAVFFIPNHKKDFTFYTNPNSNLINKNYKEKFARNITDGFAVKNIRWIKGKAYADFYTDDYTVSSNAVLSKGKWYLNNTVTVNAGITLTIEPGAELLFTKGSSLIVNGTLKAKGNSDNPIIFNSSGKGMWGSIVFNGSASAGSNLDSVIVQSETGIRFLNNANATIKNSRIENLSKAIVINNSKPNLANNKGN